MNSRFLIYYLGAVVVGIAIGYQIPGVVAKYRLNTEIKLVESQIERNPNNTDDWVFLGMVKHRNADDEGTLTAYKRALELDPLNLQAYRSMGDLYVKQGNLTEAEKWFKDALQIAIKHYPAEVYDSQLFLKYIERKKVNQSNPTMPSSGPATPTAEGLVGPPKNW